MFEGTSVEKAKAKAMSRKDDAASQLLNEGNPWADEGGGQDDALASLGQQVNTRSSQALYSYAACVIYLRCALAWLSARQGCLSLIARALDHRALDHSCNRAYKIAAVPSDSRNDRRVRGSASVFVCPTLSRQMSQSPFPHDVSRVFKV